MGILDGIFGPGFGGQGDSQAGLLAQLLNPQPMPYFGAPPADDAQAAREAAALTLQKRMGKRAAVASPFDGGAVPAPAFAGLLGAPGSMAAPQGPPDLPPATNDPTSSEPVVFQDGVKLPRPKPAAEGGIISAPTDNPGPDSGGAPPVSAAGVNGIASPDATSAYAQAPGAAPAAVPAPVAGVAPSDDGGPSFGSLFSKLLDPSKSATLLAIGAGLSGAPSLATGISRASANAIPAMAADRAFGLKQQGMTATVKALRAKGVPEADILAAVSNPEILKATVGKYFDAKPLVPHKIGVDMSGNDIMGSFNTSTGKYYDVGGREIGAVGSGLSDAGGGMFAKGVTELNQELPADEFKAQFSPSVQAQMEAYRRGDTMPTGNPRQKGSATKIKEWATLWGSKEGVPVSDATFSERRKYRTELGSNAAATAGGQAKAFDQGLEHMDSLANQLEKLGNWNGFGIPSVARTANYLREGASNTQTGVARQAATLGQTLSGEVGKLFSGSAGGGVREREETAKRFNTVDSNEALAGALEGTLQTMEGGLRALEARRDQILGPDSDVKFVTKDAESRMARIRGAISRLRGEPGAPAASSPASATPALAAPAAPAGLRQTQTGVKWSFQ